MQARTGAVEAVAGAAPVQRSRFTLLLWLVALVAFAIREHYVLATIVDVPIRGDVREYVAYAWNLLHHGVFSSTVPQETVPIADAYRSPGYPWLLATCMALLPQGDSWSALGGWYPLALQLQVLLGTATVVLATLLAKRWMGPSWAILAGMLLALWPHHITATGALISEVLFGFSLVAALYCFAQGSKTDRHSWYFGTGIAFGYAYLTNPLIALFPPFLAAVVWWLGRRKSAAILLGTFLIPVLGLGLRNAQLPTDASESAGRATMNMVQGSWPTYHATHLRYMMTRDSTSTAGMDAINGEIQLLHEDPRQGLSMMARRMRADPVQYAAWYLWRKPWLLWDWDVRLGAGGVYVYEVRNSPLEKTPLLRWTTSTLRMLNPALAALAALAAFATGAFGWRQQRWVPAAATGALAIYLTLIHVVFQAEPRYAIAYRGLEVVLAITALALACQVIGKLWKEHRLPSLQGGHQRPQS